MNIVGIIAEYNPMHNGHVYHIREAKKLANADYAIVIMSGSFTEQGNIACIDKFKRANIAIQNGADLVLELPTIFATSSSETFAFGTVNILNSLGCITHLAFGVEQDNLEELLKAAKTYNNHKDEILKDIKSAMKNGTSTHAAYAKVMKKYITDCTIDISAPNNILAIEYLKALDVLNSQIKPVLVHRRQVYHNDTEIQNTAKYASSTSIRNVLASSELAFDEKFTNIEKAVPKNTLDILKNNLFNTNETIWNNLKYEILKLRPEGLKNIHEVTEGLENRLYDIALTSNSYEDYIFNVKTKRYALSRIKRICIYILLGITKDVYKNISTANYARILKIKKESKDLLSHITKNSSTSIISKVTDDILNTLDCKTSKSIKLDILAHNIAFYSNCNLDYTNKIIQP